MLLTRRRRKSTIHAWLVACTSRELPCQMHCILLVWCLQMGGLDDERIMRDRFMKRYDHISKLFFQHSVH